jgi:hypothetical protein
MGEQFTKQRIKCKLDEFPEEVKATVNEMLQDVTVTYQQIADQLVQMGYPIGRTSICRYAQRQNKVMARLKAARETTQNLIELVKTNQDVDSAELAGAIYMDQLIARASTLEEDMELMDADQVGRQITNFQRTANYKRKVADSRKGGIAEAKEEILKAFTSELMKTDPELFSRFKKLLDTTAEKLKENASNG